MEASLLLTVAVKGETDPVVVFIFCLLGLGFWWLQREPKPPTKPPEKIESIQESKQQIEGAVRKDGFAKQAERRAASNLQASELQQSEIRRLSWVHVASLELLMSVSPHDFEGIVANLFHTHGYAVRQTPRTGDGGKDIIVERRGKTSFVECKRFARENSVGTPLLRAFLGAMAACGVRSGIFVTTSDFNANAKEFGQQHDITLINGTRLAAAFAKLSKGTEDPGRYKALCPECGSTHVYPLSAERCHTTCQCGKTIPFPLAITDLVSHAAYRHLARSCPKCGSPLKISSSCRTRLLCPNVSCDFTFSLASASR